MEELTHDTCVAGEPDCPRCELKKICPTGQARLTADKATGSSKSKVASKTKATSNSDHDEPKASGPSKKPGPKTTEPPKPSTRGKSRPSK